MSRDALDAVCPLYMFAIFVATALFYLFARPLTVHGRETRGVSKLYYFVFYLLSAVLLRGSRTCFVIHPLRRLLETLLYSRNSRSRMTHLQVAHGLLYFAVISSYLKDRPVEPVGFVALNAVQAVAHFRVYGLKKHELSHYFSEILIHGYIFWSVKTCAMFWNLAYVCAFVVASTLNRGARKTKA